MTSSRVPLSQAWRYRQQLRRVREVFATLGCPLDEMTDEEIERSAVAFGEAWSRDTLTFEQAEECIERWRQAKGETERQIGARLERIGVKEEGTDGA
jgi:hypothetical protein